MEALRIQQYLRDGGDLDALKPWYGIKYRRHQQYPNLVLLKYDQIASPFNEEIVRECRGIVLDENDDWRVVSRAFDKFFNHGEGLAATLDWSTARVQEKVDGSLCVLYWYADAWHVATTGTPDASGPVERRDLTFARLFWQTFGEAPDPTFGGWCKPGSYCLYFEICTPYNRIVVVHDEPRLIVLGARNLHTQQEVPATVAAAMLGHRHEPVREYPLDSMAGILASFDTIRPLEQEGYVVVDGAFRRVKVKHPGYVALHHAREGMSLKAFVTIAQSGEVPEVVVAFPELRPQLEDVRARLEALIAEVEAEYERHRGAPDMKTFALAIRGSRCTSALFAVKRGQAESVRHFFATYRAENLMELLGLKEARETGEAA
jgi:hypothetical protein